MMDQYKKIKSDERYSDFYNNMTVHPETGELLRKKNNAAIRQSVKNIILTYVGERPFSDLGCDVSAAVFELFSSKAENSIENSIRLAIENYEPRCMIQKLTVAADEPNHKYTVTLYYIPLYDTDVEKLVVNLSRVR